MSNDRWTPRYEHDEAEPMPEAPQPPAEPEQPVRASTTAPDWGGGSGSSPTAKDWHEGRVDPAPWQQGMTANELAASSKELETAEEPAVESEPENSDEGAAAVPAVREPEHLPDLALPNASGLLYALGMIAALLYVVPGFVGAAELLTTGAGLGIVIPTIAMYLGILLGAHVVLRILLEIGKATAHIARRND